MRNVAINGKRVEKKVDTPVKLSNGSLVVHYNKLGDVIGAYIVTSYRDQSGYCKHNGKETSQYCSLVDLDTGYLKFEERCSRNTTMGRVLAHLVPNGDFGGKDAVKDGQYIEVYTGGNYKIDLSFDRENNSVK